MREEFECETCPDEDALSVQGVRAFGEVWIGGDVMVSPERAREIAASILRAAEHIEAVSVDD